MTSQPSIVGTVAGVVVMHGVDIYYLRDGKGYAGVSYFDPRPMLGAEPTGD